MGVCMAGRNGNEKRQGKWYWNASVFFAKSLNRVMSPATALIPSPVKSKQNQKQIKKKKGRDPPFPP